jgi:glycosyltransferase involved in cell wall biosynthesis
MTNVSVIIPHKNSGLLLKRLLESVPKDEQYQVIVCDDHSKDDELGIVKELQQQYNFELYENEGFGAGGARNTALKHAEGKWLLFADSDDFFMSPLEEMVKKYMESDADIVYFNVDSCYSESLKPAYRGKHVNGLVETYKRTGNDKVLRFKHLSPWGKLIKTSLVKDNDIKFEEIIAANDNMFCILTGLKANKVVCEDVAIYMVTLSEGSSITTQLSKERFESKLYATIRVNKLLRKSGYGKYQKSVLYFIGMGFRIGFFYGLSVLWVIIKNGLNPFIGLGKIFQPQEIKKNIDIPVVQEKA